MRIRHAHERGSFDHGWLRTAHTFSFADYHDPRFMGFRTLRVLNDDWIAPGRGFGAHPHRDMEIVTYVLEGELAHRDSMGNGSVIRPGDVQRMSAGTGVVHSEVNPSKDRAVHLLQIWILPGQRGIAPGYEQKTFSDADKRGRLCLIASPDGREGSVTIHTDAAIYAALLDGQESVDRAVPAGRAAWVHVATGAVHVNGEPLSAGDAAAFEGGTIRLDRGQAANILLFDLP